MKLLKFSGWFAGTLISFGLFCAFAQTQYDLLLQGGHVIDPKNHISAVRDVAIRDGKIAAIGRLNAAQTPLDEPRHGEDRNAVKLAWRMVDQVAAPLRREIEMGERFMARRLATFTDRAELVIGIPWTGRHTVAQPLHVDIGAPLAQPLNQTAAAKRFVVRVRAEDDDRKVLIGSFQFALQ